MINNWSYTTPASMRLMGGQDAVHIASIYFVANYWVGVLAHSLFVLLILNILAALPKGKNTLDI